MPVKFLVCVHQVSCRLDWKLGVVDREGLLLDGLVATGALKVFKDGDDLAPIPNMLVELRASAIPLMSKKAATTAITRNIILS